MVLGGMGGRANYLLLLTQIGLRCAVTIRRLYIVHCQEEKFYIKSPQSVLLIKMKALESDGHCLFGCCV